MLLLCEQILGLILRGGMLFWGSGACTCFISEQSLGLILGRYAFLGFGGMHMLHQCASQTTTSGAALHACSDVCLFIGPHTPTSLGRTSLCTPQTSTQPAIFYAQHQHPTRPPHDHTACVPPLPCPPPPPPPPQRWRCWMLTPTSPCPSTQTWAYPPQCSCPSLAPWPSFRPP
jgi:hypothetical protein